MSGAASSRKPAKDGGGRFWEARPPSPASEARSARRLAAGIAAASLLAHGGLLLALVLSEPPSNFPEPIREIPVEIVPELSAPETSPGGAGASVKPVKLQETAQEAKPAATPDSAMRAPEVPLDDSPNDLVNDAKAETAARGIADEAGRAGRRRTAGASPARPFDSEPDRFRAAAVPLPAGSGGEAMSYRFIVGGMLERVKQYPGSARRRGAKGIATIRFILDQSGGVVSVVLLRSSGQTDLDAESVSLVTRAAPFPPPPPGAEHSFSIDVAFGMGR